MNVYTPESDRIVHNAIVDFKKRGVVKPLHLVQYDRGLPIIAVELYSDGEIYKLPSTAEANVRLKKRDGKIVFNPVLGCNDSRTVLYFETTYQMTSVNGRITPVLEITIKDEVAASSAIEIEIDRNPIQEGDIQSTDEVKTIEKKVEEVKKYADNANLSAINAKTSETNAKKSENLAKISETNAKESEIKATISEVNAKESETNASTSESKARISEINALNSANASKTSETNAKTSELKAETSKSKSEESERNSAVSEANAREFEKNASTSEMNAKTSETNALQSADSAKTSEINAKASETKSKESETNSKTSEINASDSAMAAKVSEGNAKTSETKAKESEINALEYARIAEETDVGALSSSLGKRMLIMNISDSDGNPVLDGASSSIETVMYFIDDQTIAAMTNRIEALEHIVLDFVRNFSYENANVRLIQFDNLAKECGTYFDKVDKNISDISMLKEHSVLDSNYN